MRLERISGKIKEAHFTRGNEEWRDMISSVSNIFTKQEKLKYSTQRLGGRFQEEQESVCSHPFHDFSIYFFTSFLITNSRAINIRLSTIGTS